MGYQLTFKKRFTFDIFILAPSYSHFSFEIDFDPTSDLDNDSEFYNDFEDRLSTIVPGIEAILNIDDIDFQGDEHIKFNKAFLMRYGVQLSYMF